MKKLALISLIVMTASIPSYSLNKVGWIAMAADSDITSVEIDISLQDKTVKKIKTNPQLPIFYPIHLGYSPLVQRTLFNAQFYKNTGGLLFSDELLENMFPDYLPSPLTEKHFFQRAYDLNTSVISVDKNKPERGDAFPTNSSYAILPRNSIELKRTSKNKSHHKRKRILNSELESPKYYS